MTVATKELWVSRRAQTADGVRLVPGQIMRGPIGREMQIQTGGQSGNHWCATIDPHTALTTCAECGERFAWPTSMDAHTKLVHGEQPPEVLDVAEAHRRKITRQAAEGNRQAQWEAEAFELLDALKARLAELKTALSAAADERTLALGELRRFEREGDKADPAFYGEASSREYRFNTTDTTWRRAGVAVDQCEKDVRAASRESASRSGRAVSPYWEPRQ